MTDITKSKIKIIEPFTEDDIRLIRSNFSKKRKIVYYCMAVFFALGLMVSAFALFLEIQKARDIHDLVNSIRYWEVLIPFFIGTGAMIICLLVLVVFHQEINIELNNNKKCIYKGVVTKRSENAVRTGTGSNRDTQYYYHIYLGDISFEHEDLYFEINEGDTIDVQISEKLKIVLSKNITKNRRVAEVMPEIKETLGIFNIVESKHDVGKWTAPLTEEENEALKAQMQKISKRILSVAIILSLALGAAAEIILWHDHYYTWDQSLAIRLGFWGSPVAFLGLLLFRKLVPVLKDIHRGEKLIILEKVINKEEYKWASAQEVSYYINGLTEKTEVPHDIFNALGAGDDYELHKTITRGKLLVLVIPKSGIKYKNPDFFQT